MEMASAAHDLLANLSYSNLLRIRDLSNEGKQQEKQKIKQELETLQAETKPALPQMKSWEFLKYLAAVDIDDSDRFQAFLEATQIQPSANLPEYIPIGSHSGVQYFIKSSDIEIPEDLSSARTGEYVLPRTRHDSLFEMPDTGDEPLFDGLREPNDDSSVSTQMESGSSVDQPPLPIEHEVSAGIPPQERDSPLGTSPPQDLELYSGMLHFTAKSIPSCMPVTIDLTYGFGLGRLCHQMPDALQPQDSAFYVICNAMDKSIWIAFDFEPYGETGDIVQVRPEYGDPYGQLPGDKEEVMIGARKLFSGDWMASKQLSLDHGDPFEYTASEPALAVKLFATPASIASMSRTFMNPVRIFAGG